MTRVQDPLRKLLDRWRHELLTSTRRANWNPEVRRGAEQMLETNIAELAAALKESAALAHSP